jgi:hypothetical protein
MKEHKSYWNAKALPLDEKHQLATMIGSSSVSILEVSSIFV